MKLLFAVIGVIIIAFVISFKLNLPQDAEGINCGAIQIYANLEESKNTESYAPTVKAMNCFKKAMANCQPAHFKVKLNTWESDSTETDYRTQRNGSGCEIHFSENYFFNGVNKLNEGTCEYLGLFEKIPDGRTGYLDTSTCQSEK